MCVLRLTKEQLADAQRQLDQWKKDHPAEVEALRKHIDEAMNDPDYAVVGNYADIPDSKPTCCVGWKPEDSPRKS